MTYWLARAKSSILLAVLLGLLSISSGSCGVLPYQRRVSLATAARGVNADISSMLPGTPYSITTISGGNFFDLAAQLGINTLRITDVQWEMTGKEYPQSSWRYVFDEAASHHMNVVLLLLDGNGHLAIQQAHMLLGTYGLAHASALWMVDLYNEPDLGDPQLMTTLLNEAAYVRQTAPSAYVTIGGWKSQVLGHPGEFNWEDPADIPRLINLVDVVSPHLYGFNQEALPSLTPQKWARDYLSAVRRVSPNKPILLEEFGVSNGLAPTTSAIATGSIVLQASVYRGVLQEVAAEHDRGVIGALAWIIAPRPAWPGDLQGDMTGWAFVLDHGHRLLSAANEFSISAHP